MPIYKIVFRNGETRKLVLAADSIDRPKGGVYTLRANDDEKRVLAIIPEDQVLYIIEEDKESF